MRMHTAATRRSAILGTVFMAAILSRILVARSIFAAHEWYAGKPFMFLDYLDRMLVKVAFEDPKTLTSLGFLESMGINGHNAHLDDVHPDRTAEFFADIKAFGDGHAHKCLVQKRSVEEVTYCMDTFERGDDLLDDV